MALRDQPYLPLYVQDFLTDEKLNECSAESIGVYIMLMCVLHKSTDYGTILLRQKDKICRDKISDFAAKLTRHLPFDADTIRRALTELLDENVISIDGDKLFQKRMVKDSEISEKRATAGKKGSVKTNSKDFAAAKSSANVSAKVAANSEIEIENENINEIDNENTTENSISSTEVNSQKIKKRKSILSKEQVEQFNRFWACYPKKVSPGAAEKAWVKILPDEALTAKIIDAVGRAKSKDKRFQDSDYTPHPATWLNARSWENEYDPLENPAHSAPRGSAVKPDAIGVLEQMLREEEPL